jgi:NADH-quinone oxidoreductase subunit J
VKSPKHWNWTHRIDDNPYIRTSLTMAGPDPAIQAYFAAQTRGCWMAGSVAGHGELNKLFGFSHDMLQAIAFYLFSAVMIGAAFMVVAARNPVHSVLFLILAFFNAAALFVLLGAEFLAMILLVVYVGAVAVLFLFVVMMLDIDFAELRQGFQRYLPFGALLGLVFLSELAIVLGGWALGGGMPLSHPVPAQVTNTAALGRILYTDYIFYFQTAGLILLVAMIGAIVLTLRRRAGVKHQSIWRQVTREPKEAVTLHDIKPGQGVP